MYDSHVLALSQYRLQQAREDLIGAEQNLELGQYKIANNRAYYSIFHAMRAVLALDRMDFKKHSGVISYFREQYIKSGKVPAEYSKIITSASLIRNKSDYEDFYIASQSEAAGQIDGARRFLAEIESLLGALEE